MRIIPSASVFPLSLLLCSCGGENIPSQPSHPPTSNSPKQTRESPTTASQGDKMASSSENPLDWTKLPEELRYLAITAEKYGHYQFEDRIYDFLMNKMTPEEKQELMELSKRGGRDKRLINQWLDKYNMTVHKEARLVYFTMVLVGTGCDSGLLR
jgi:hypothetical protein